MNKILNFMKVVRPGDHIVLFYESQGFKHEVLFTYLKSGLEKGITTLYFSHREPAAEILTGMRSFGIEVERYAKEGLFELWEIKPDLQLTAIPLQVKQSTKVEPSSNEPPSIHFARFMAYLEGKTIKKPLVVVADDPLQNLDTKAIFEYEKFHSLRLQYTPISLICTYSVKEVSWEGNLFLDLVKTHRHIIIQTCGTIITLQDGKPE